LLAFASYAPEIRGLNCKACVQDQQNKPARDKTGRLVQYQSIANDLRGQKVLASRSELSSPPRLAWWPAAFGLASPTLPVRCDRGIHRHWCRGERSAFSTEAVLPLVKSSRRRPRRLA